MGSSAELACRFLNKTEIEKPPKHPFGQSLSGSYFFYLFIFF